MAHLANILYTWTPYIIIEDRPQKDFICDFKQWKKLVLVQAYFQADQWMVGLFEIVIPLLILPAMLNRKWLLLTFYICQEMSL